MKILIIGGGGREHALAWKSAQSSIADKVYVAPGNAGTAQEANIENVSIDAENVDELLQFALKKKIGLTIVGPEVPLVLGIVDRFTAAGLKCFGPTQAASQLEGSKAFCKDFLAKHKIPTADYRTFIDIDPAIDYIRSKGTPIVVKADGLAAGKGVIIAHTEKEAIDAVKDMLSANKFGDAGHRVVIEEFLSGEEASFIVMVDGEHILPLATSQDHKAAFDGDQGPNTGGMGAYSPAPMVTDEIYQRIMSEVIIPTVEGMKADGRPYTGFLYAGIMITADKQTKVLEYNCRFGDPETQPIMMRLNSDLIELCLAGIDGTLDQCEAKWDNRVALGVVLTAGGYPGNYTKGNVISGLDKNNQQNHKIFHAGTALKNDIIVTSGGRVLCAVALGKDIKQAQEEAYSIVKSIHWEGIQYRHDIGYRAINYRGIL